MRLNIGPRLRTPHFGDQSDHALVRLRLSPVRIKVVIQADLRGVYCGKFVIEAKLLTRDCCSCRSSCKSKSTGPQRNGEPTGCQLQPQPCTPFQHTQSTDTMPYPALGSDMRRREFITLIGCGAAAWSLEARAQQSTFPVIGFLNTASSGDHVATANAFRQGLKDTGYVDG